MSKEKFDNYDVTSVFNTANDNWKSGRYDLFLGEPLALYDSINTPYPQLFDLYKLQKSLDWSEDEVNLEQSRLDLLSCSKNNYDIMIKTLAFQWELDSVASRSIAPLFAPFVSNSELWIMFMKQTEIEMTHSLTYSEIIRQCIADPQEVFKEVMKNDEVLNRSTTVVDCFDDLNKYGALYTLGKIDRDSEELRFVVLKGIIALYCLERIEFMSSFACTFALAEQNIFMGIAKLVQKIMIDEDIHRRMDEAVISILFKDPKWHNLFLENVDFFYDLIESVVQQEFDWNNYLFSEGRAVVGLNKELLNEWVIWNAQMVYDHLGLESPFKRINSNPLLWMDNWLDIDKTQNANQEIDNTSYRLNSVDNDLDEEEVFDI